MSSSAITLATICTAVVLPVLALSTSANAVGPANQKVGNCYRYSITDVDQRDAPAAAPVPCKGPHKAKTIAIGRFPTGATYMGASAITIYKACVPKLWKVLGGTDASRARSAYTFSFYTATKAQWATGARWFRCDANLLAQDMESGKDRLLDLPTATPYLANGVSRKEKRCLEYKDHYGPFSCANGYRGWEIKSTFKVAGKAYPARKKFVAIATKQCKRIVGRNWYANWPNKVAWKLGTRQLACYKKTI